MSIRPRQSASYALAAALLALGPVPAGAAGFAIFEQGAKGMGFAGAFTAQSDPSSIFHNAAGIAFLKGNQLHLGGTMISPKSEFTGADPFPGAAVTEKGDAGISIPPVADLTHQVSENLVLGVGLHVPYGLKTAWENPEAYSGRFISKRAELKGFALIPTIAYKLADRLAVGAGLDVRFASVSLKRNLAAVNPFTQRVVDVAAVDLDSDTATGFGFNVGILAKPNESVSIGAAYRHKVKVDFSGTGTFTTIPTGNVQFDALVSNTVPRGAETVKTAIEFPAIASFGLAYTTGDWTFEADADYYQWSSFDELPLSFEDRPDLSGVIPENYEDTWQYRVGIERRIGDTWAVRGGYFFDQTPTPLASMGPLLPDADRNGAAFGLSWKRGQFQLDLGYWHLFFKERSTEGVNRDNYNGTYKSSADLVAVSLGFGF